MINIGDNIKKFRELKNITREQVAAALDMSLSNYSKIERGEIDLTLSKIEKISQLLEVDLSQILNFDASQIFYVSNNKVVHVVNSKADNLYFSSDDHKDKYIKMLEAENAKLKAGVKK